MKNAYSYIIAAMALLLLASGCRKKEIGDFSPLYQSIDVKFFKDNNTSSAIALFYKGGAGGNKAYFLDRNLIQLNGVTDSGINNNTPDFFRWSFAGQPDMTFTLKKENSTVVNKVLRSDIKDFDIEIDSFFSVNDTIKAKWIGPDLEDGETVGISFNRESDSSGLWSGISGEATGRYFVLKYSETKMFHPGVYHVAAARIKRMPLQQNDGGAGGNITVSLYVNKTVVIR